MFVTDDGQIIEAGWHVVQRHIECHDGESYCVVHLDGVADSDRSEMTAFMASRLGAPYGLLNVVSVGLTMLSGIPIVIAREGHPICSGLVARALERSSFTCPHEPLAMSPAHLARMFSVQRPAT
jgi:hypothetical protein